jgi:hypothetical protein
VHPPDAAIPSFTAIGSLLERNAGDARGTAESVVAVVAIQEDFVFIS